MSYRILCIDDDAEFLLTLKIQLKKNFKVHTAQGLREGKALIAQENIDLVLLDVKLGQENGIEGLAQIKTEFPDVDVVMVSGFRDPKMIVTAIRAGASDYLCKPFAHDELLAVIEKVQKLGGLRERHAALIREGNATSAGRALIGESATFQNLLKQVQCVRGHIANILIEGESGTGKELLARYVHNLEGNANRPFIAVNCAAIPETLIESELFGHEKGSFSGALQRKIGKFELAAGGDIFLDEINSLKPELQAKILRVIQEKELYRVGGNTPIQTQFRVIAATNANLDRLVAAGTFRMDLFHRLRVVSFRIPPLRERKEDIAVLVRHFVKKHSSNGAAKTISPEVMRLIHDYRWPGNVRELENLIHSLLIMAPGAVIEAADLPDWIRQEATFSDALPVDSLPSSRMASEGTAAIVPLKHFVQNVEREYVGRILRIQNGDKTKAAELLGISRTSLYEKIKGTDLH